MKSNKFRVFIRDSELGPNFSSLGHYDSLFQALKACARFYRGCGKMSIRPGLFEDQLMVERELLAYDTFAMICKPGDTP